MSTRFVLIMYLIYVGLGLVHLACPLTKSSVALTTYYQIIGDVIDLRSLKRPFDEHEAKIF